MAERHDEDDGRTGPSAARQRRGARPTSFPSISVREKGHGDDAREAVQPAGDRGRARRRTLSGPPGRAAR